MDMVDSVVGLRQIISDISADDNNVTVQQPSIPMPVTVAAVKINLASLS